MTNSSSTWIDFGPTSPGWDRTVCAPNPTFQHAEVVVLSFGAIAAVNLAKARLELAAIAFGNMCASGGKFDGCVETELHHAARALSAAIREAKP